MQEIGEDRFWCKNPVYGSNDERNVPLLRLKSLTVCRSDPLEEGQHRRFLHLAKYIYLRSEDRCVLVDAETTKSVSGRTDSLNAVVHSDIPELYLSAPATTDELALTTALQMDIRNPLLMLFPHPHHCCLRLLTLVIHSHRTVTEASNENISLNLIGCQRGNARSGPSRNVL